MRKANLILAGLLLLGVLVRLYHIDPPAFGHHDIRQYDTAAIARNFADEGMNPLYPRIDWRGGSPGYVESEFPIYTYLLAALYKTFGPHQVLARGLSIAAYVLTGLVLFGFARRLFDERAALFAVFFYSVVPLSYFFTLSIQPDALMVLASLAGVHFFMQWSESARAPLLVLSWFCLSVAILVKPMNVYLAIPIAYVCWQSFGWRFVRRPTLWLFAAAVIVPPILWYVHAYELWELYGNTLFRAYSKLDFTWLFVDRWTWPGPILSLGSPSYASDMAFRILFLVATPAGLYLLFAGFGAANTDRGRLLYWWLGAFLVTMVVFADQHRRHDYYQLPIVPVLATMMGLGTARLIAGSFSRLAAVVVTTPMVFYVAWWFNSEQASLFARYEYNAYGVSMLRFVWVGLACATLAIAAVWKGEAQSRAVAGVLLALTIAASAWQSAKLFELTPNHLERVEFAKRLQQATSDEDRIVFATVREWRPGWYQHRTRQGEYLYHDPTDFYLSGRKGWSVAEEQVTIDMLEELRREGASFFATFCCMYREREVLADNPAVKNLIQCLYTNVDVNDRWWVVRLDEPSTNYCEADVASTFTP